MDSKIKYSPQFNRQWWISGMFDQPIPSRNSETFKILSTQARDYAIPASCGPVERLFLTVVGHLFPKKRNRTTSKTLEMQVLLDYWQKIEEKHDWIFLEATLKIEKYFDVFLFIASWISLIFQHITHFLCSLPARTLLTISFFFTQMSLFSLRVG